MTIDETKAAIDRLPGKTDLLLDDWHYVPTRDELQPGYANLTTDTLTALAADHSRLEAENSKLREALEQRQAIIDLYRGACNWEYQALCSKLAAVKAVTAQAALAEDGGR